jgi:hypothetical protein
MCHAIAKIAVSYRVFLYAQVFDEVVTKLGLLVPQDGRIIKQNQSQPSKRK